MANVSNERARMRAWARAKRLQSRNAGHLVEMLRDVQRNDELSRADLAQRLGVSASMVNMVFGGWRSPGPKFLHGVLKAFPHLSDEVHLFLLQNMTDSEDDDIFR